MLLMCGSEVSKGVEVMERDGRETEERERETEGSRGDANAVKML